MPRYYFNVFNGYSPYDRDGMEMPDLLAALQAGIGLAGKLLSQDAHQMQLKQNWRMEITDDDGRMMFRLDFTTTGSAAASVLMKRG